MSSEIGPRFFCFDLGSPLCWLAAERILATVAGPVEWVPVRACELPGAERFDSFRCATEREVFQEEVARRAAELGVGEAVRWPEPFPFDSDLAMRAAAYARSIGRAVAFALAAFRQAFQGGHALDEDFTLIAAAACEMHPQAVLAGARSAGVARRLREDAARAAAQGVSDLPAVVIDGEAFVGERALEAAGAAAAGAPGSTSAPGAIIDVLEEADAEEAG